MTAPQRVLVVEDDDTIRAMIKKRLEVSGYQTLEASNGQQALDVLASAEVDLVILDLMMPTLDGYQTLERLRARHSFNELPVIILSAKDGRDDVISALRVGANDYAVKPIDFALLLKRVAVHLDLKAASNRRVGAYQLKRQIGAGGMGVVYEASDTQTSRSIALKVLPRAQTLNPEFVGRFLREGQLAYQLDHPNLVRVYEVGKEGEIYFIAMELVLGDDLAAARAKRAFSVDEALRITRQIASGLEALHARGIIHRDVKPENVILAEDGTAKLTDLGIAREVGTAARLTDAGIAVGSVLFASPEQIGGDSDHRSDLYSLGCTLYFLLTGSAPFAEGESLTEIIAKKHASVPALRDVPPAVDKLVRKMMRPKREQRPQGCAEVIAAIDAVNAAPAPRRSWLRRLLLPR